MKNFKNLKLKSVGSCIFSCSIRHSDGQLVHSNQSVRFYIHRLSVTHVIIQLVIQSTNNVITQSISQSCYHTISQSVSNSVITNPVISHTIMEYRCKLLTQSASNSITKYRCKSVGQLVMYSQTTGVSQSVSNAITEYRFKSVSQSVNQ